jgi:hypothetical protein
MIFTVRDSVRQADTGISQSVNKAEVEGEKQLTPTTCYQLQAYRERLSLTICAQRARRICSAVQKQRDSWYNQLVAIVTDIPAGAGICRSVQ